ncbi:MAG: hypothetical protein RSB67_01430 [Clostridia bacterium]
MLNNKKKLIIFIIISIVALGLFILFCLVDVNLGIIKFSSIKSLIDNHSIVSQAEETLIKAEDSYKTTKKSLEDEKLNYSKEKQKYEAISNETIDIIKDATTKEKYSIEYMWIRLGNYARVNNLSIIVVEPGGKENTVIDKKDETKAATSDTTTTTTQETSQKETAPKLPSLEFPNIGSGNNIEDTIFKIQVSGSYIDVSSFVFEVENDKELRFKLDNIVMEYVEGTTIKATFNVKNLTINK